jgi:hypothetical protein
MPREARIDAVRALQHLISRRIERRISPCHVPITFMDVPTSVIFEDLPFVLLIVSTNRLGSLTYVSEK